MELMGVVNGLDFISLEEDKCDEVETIIFSDSMYVLKVLLASLTIKNRIKMFEHSILRVKNRKQYMITKAAPGHEEDGDLIYRLRQLIDKFKLQFIQVSKPLVPIQHAKCHEIASEMRWKLAIELGFAKSRHRHISERNDNI
ncbi:MAG: hypothetical protein JWM56_800 [Candidatus Peribacteria bacterium]|nr:hypothetical protein [Candidatus Peribacteria bacterium]